MTMVNDDDLITQRANDIEAAGQSRYGKDTWPAMIGALGRAGLGPQVSQIIGAGVPDAFDRVARAGREALLNECSSDDREVARNADAAYSALRQRERGRRHSASAYRSLEPNVEKS
jgi:hypothetical protein